MLEFDREKGKIIVTTKTQPYIKGGPNRKQRRLHLNQPRYYQLSQKCVDIVKFIKNKTGKNIEIPKNKQGKYLTGFYSQLLNTKV